MKYLTLLLSAFILAAAGFQFQPPAPQDRAWISKNWGLLNDWGVDHHHFRSHINAPAAWNFAIFKKRVVVAVVDTGVDSAHPQLQGTISRYGWNFVSDSRVTKDANGHGTHISGIITATSDSRALILPIEYFSDSNPGRVNLSNTVKSIWYAVDHAAKIINYSGGGPEFSEPELLALKYAKAHGVLVVAAAGNDHQDTDVPKNRYYPAAYGLSNMIVVASTDIKNELLQSSNWGLKSVNVAAPGENIYSTLPGGKFGYVSGTSQATAFVTGIATLILAENPKLTPKQVITAICESVDPIDELQSKTQCGGRVNAYAAVVRAKAFTSP